jgi:DNA polymerase-3 subunit delta'
MSFASIVGHDRVIHSLKAGLESDQLHHAYLFGGLEGIGKELTAKVLAQSVNCEQRKADACGQCGPCLRVASRNHPDVQYVMAEAEQVARGWAGRSDFSGTPSREIKIGQIRRLQERLSLKALEARKKVALVINADAMNAQAQNSLLKTLEEPPGDTILILVSAAPNSLLPTIRSRCFKLTFGPLPLDFVAQRVVQEKKVDTQTAFLCAAMAAGSLSQALALDSSALAQRKELIQRLEQLAPGEARSALHFAADFAADRAQAELHLDLICTWYRDVAALSSGAPAETIIHRDLAELAVQTAQKIGAVEALRRIDLCHSTKNSFRFNASPRLQMEQATLRFLFPDL